MGEGQPKEMLAFFSVELVVSLSFNWTSVGSQLNGDDFSPFDNPSLQTVLICNCFGGKRRKKKID